VSNNDIPSPPATTTATSTPGTQCHTRKRCGLCGSTDLVSALRLAPSPIANAFVGPDRLHASDPRLPLDLGRCRACGHVQLLSIVDRYQLFTRNIDAHSASPTMVAHLRAFARQLMERYPSGKDALVVEIGCNDGTFLKAFEDAGRRVHGVEAAANLAGQAVARGVRTHAGFFSPSIAERIEEERGRAAYLIAQMAFAQAEDLGELLEGVSLLLARDGIFAFEVPYLGEMIRLGAYDSITHRVLDYHALRPLVPFLAANDLEIIAVDRTPSHRGSLRGIAQRLGGPYPTDASVAALLAEEGQIGLGAAENLAGFAMRVERSRAALLQMLHQLKAAGARIAGYGATACSTTLLHHIGIDAAVFDFIIDDTPAKQGLYTPGLHIPIRDSSALYEDRPDYVLVLAWNFTEGIVARHERFSAIGGRFLVPLPEPRLL
jgi:Predicted methyltransferase (contains TPR repeat)